VIRIISLYHNIYKVLIEAMKFDIDVGIFCDVLLKKIRNNDCGNGNTKRPLVPGLCVVTT
jgi:hypothetical protein